MAKSKESFNKKEKEKKKLKERKEKQEKMEERKNNAKKGKSLEEMMAYVDENGNITDTPPDPRNRKQVKAEDIQIGVPKQEDIEDVPLTGTVIFFDESKGFGFIGDQQSGERVFVHANNLMEPIAASDKVVYELGAGPRGPMAINVKKQV